MVVDMGKRSRMIVSVVDVVGPPQPLPKLPLTSDHLEDFPDIAGIELLLIDEETRPHAFRQELGSNEVVDQPAVSIR